MRKIWMLAAANLRKGKSQAVSLLIFVMIAASFLNVGLVLYFGIGGFFDERAEQLHTSHFSIAQPESVSTEEPLRYLEQYPGVTEVETQGILAGPGNYFVNDSQNSGILVFTPLDKNQQMNPPSLIGDTLPLTNNAIYLPYFMMKDGGYEIGDKCRLIFNGVELSLTVAGGTEEIMFGTMMNLAYRVYVSDEAFLRLQQQFPDHHYTLLSARLKHQDDAMLLQADYSKKFFYAENAANSPTASLFDISYEGARSARIIIPTITALLVTSIAIILLVVSLIVIRFRITSTIEESMTNIGVLKAMGYGNAHIVSSIVLQFGLVALIGSIAGIALAQITIPVIAKLLEPQLALVWNPGFDAPAALATLLLALFTVLLISFLSAKRINVLHPLIALRGGITTHNFRKNHVPLEQSRGPLVLLLAIKQLLQNKKQALMITITIAAVTMASVAGLALHYNMNVERNAFIYTIAGEIPDANFQLKDEKDSISFQKKLEIHPDVRKVLGYQPGISLLAGNTNISATVVGDCSQLEGSLLVNGRYPKHSNEIALGTICAKINGKTIGDTITVKAGGHEKEYLITGIIQLMSNYGMNAIINDSGLRELHPDFIFVSFYAYLNHSTDAHQFVEDMKNTDGDRFLAAIDIKEQTTAQFGSIGDIFSALAIGILCITVIVVVLVLYLVIKTTILRQKRQLGIQKALGFTTFLLMNQIALNLTPVIVLGVVIGAIGGYYGLNPIFIALTNSMGIVKAELITPLNWTIMACIGLVLLAYFVSMVIAWRIRKISAYTLISE